MTAMTRMAVLDLRTIAAYHRQTLLTAAVAILGLARQPVFVVPALAWVVPLTVGMLFQISDKEDLQILYAVLPLTRHAVLAGHYLWALAAFLTTTAVGTPLALVLARAQNVSFPGRALAAVLTVSWAICAITIAIQIPLFTRFGYTRVSALTTFLPMLLIGLVAPRLHLTVTTPTPADLVLLGLAGAIALLASFTIAVAADRSRASRSSWSRPAGSR
ncbi:MAG TPA: ABC-2 transporter permease [Kineosporiaceae bacterium]